MYIYIYTYIIYTQVKPLRIVAQVQDPETAEKLQQAQETQ